MIRPAVYTVTTAFRVGRGSGRPATVPFSVVFGVKGFGRPAVVTVPISFALRAPDPTIFVFGPGGWQSTAQLVLTASGWVPPA